MDIKAFGDGGELREAPMEFVVLRKGTNKFTINGKQSCFTLGEDDAKAIVSEFNDRKKDVVIDWDHATLNKAAASTGDSPAAGWTRLELTNNGIVAKIVNWTKKAKDRISNGEYRYFSPVINFDNGKPRAIHSIGLTNHPAIHEQMPLVAANDLMPDMEGTVVVDEGLNLVMTSYEEMGRKLKSTIRELQGELTNVFDSMGKLAMNNPLVEQRVTAFSDALFKEDLKAFADEYGNVETVIPSVDDVRADIVGNVMGGITVDQIISNAMAGDGSMEDKRLAAMQQLTSMNEQLKMRRDTQITAMSTADENARTAIEPLIAVYNDYIAQFDAAIAKVRGMGTLAFADTNEDAEKTVGAIMDYIRKIIEPLPMTRGDILKKVYDGLGAMLNVSPETAKVVEEIAKEAPLSPTRERVYATFNDIGLQKCSNDDELINAVKALHDSHKELESKWLAKSAKEEEDAKARLALNDQIATLKAERAVDAVIYGRHGKITEGMRTWAIQFAKRDPQGFTEYIEHAPVAFTDIKPMKEDKLLKKTPSYSDEAIKIAKSFGHQPEDVYQQ